MVAAEPLDPRGRVGQRLPSGPELHLERGGEQAALRLYRKLPQGTEVAATVDAVNEALRSLAGRELESIQVRVVGPGVFALTIQAGGAEMSVHLDRHGARLSSVGV